MNVWEGITMQAKIFIFLLLGSLSLSSWIYASDQIYEEIDNDVYSSMVSSISLFSLQDELKQANLKIQELQEYQKKQEMFLQELREDLKKVIVCNKKFFYDELCQINRNIQQSITELQKKSIQLEKHQSDLVVAFNKGMKVDIPKYLIEKYNAKHINVPGFSDVNDRMPSVADALVKMRDRNDKLEQRLDENEYTTGIGELTKVDRYSGYVGAALILNSIARMLTIAAPIARLVAPCVWHLYFASRLGAIPGCSLVLGKVCTGFAWGVGLGYGLVPLGIWFSVKGIYDVYYRDTDLRKRDSAKQSFLKSCSLIKNSLVPTLGAAVVLIVVGMLAERK